MSHRVLQVVWTGVGWDRLGPLLDHGLLPALATLRAGGCAGHLTSLQPQVDIQINQSLLSGQYPGRHGLLHPLREDRQPALLCDAEVPGLPGWLAGADRPALWVGWPHAAPGLHETQHFVARGFGHDDRLADPDLPLRGLRVDADALGIDHLRPFFPNRTDAEVLADPAVPWLRRALAQASSLQAAATRLMQRKEWQLASIRFELSDRIGQAFGDCHPPLVDAASPTRAIRYQYLVTGAFRFLDMMLARLVQLAGTDTLIVVHSDRGTPRPQPPSDPEAPIHQRYRAGHEDRGFIVLSGAGVRHGADLWAASILDLAPTFLEVLGLAAPEGPGRVLAEGLDPSRVDPPRPLPETVPSDTRATPDLRQAVSADMAHHNEWEPAWDDATPTDEQALYRALSLLQSGEPAEALAIFETLTAREPPVRRHVLHRARCHLALGELQQARIWAERFLQLGDPDLRSHLLLGRIALLEDDTDAALVHFFQAEQLRPDDPVSHAQIGEAYRRADRLDQARDAFQRALGLDPVSVEARLGLARVELQVGDDEAACQACLQALEADYRQPDAHFHLGVGLARLGKVTEAIQALETCLRLSPGLIPAHEWLARLYRLTEDGLERAAVHQARVLASRQAD